MLTALGACRARGRGGVMRVLEFFSGIGGWRCALDRLDQDFEVAAAFDVNTVCNQVYEHNFGVKPSPKCINSITKKMLDKYQAEMWCMSPPCQPFTRSNTSGRRDCDDQRSSAFLHLVQLLKEVDCRPTYIALENVVGFEASECCHIFLQALFELEYSVVEFILTPTQFGIPNSRPRYYLLAYRSGGCATSPLWESIALDNSNKDIFEEGFKAGGHDTSLRDSILHAIPNTEVNCTENGADQLRDISEYLEHPAFDDTEFIIPFSTLTKPSSWCFDIVSPHDKHTACFTKAYSRYAKGTGSVLTTSEWTVIDGETKGVATNAGEDCQRAKRQRIDDSNLGTVQVSNRPIDSDKAGTANVSSLDQNEEKKGEKNCLTEDQINSLRLRYFTPSELLRLFGFPNSKFDFPSNLSTRKSYELIGNSLNVDVVSHLIQFMLRNANIENDKK